MVELSVAPIRDERSRYVGMTPEEALRSYRRLALQGPIAGAVAAFALLFLCSFTDFLPQAIELLVIFAILIVVELALLMRADLSLPPISNDDCNPAQIYGIIALARQNPRGVINHRVIRLAEQSLEAPMLVNLGRFEEARALYEGRKSKDTFLGRYSDSTLRVSLASADHDLEALREERAKLQELLADSSCKGSLYEKVSFSLATTDSYIAREEGDAEAALEARARMVQFSWCNICVVASNYHGAIAAEAMGDLSLARALHGSVVDCGGSTGMARSSRAWLVAHVR